MADLFLVQRTSGRRADDAKGPPSLVRTVLSIVLLVLGVFALLGILFALRTLILLLIFSVLFAYLVVPLVAFVQRRLAVGRGRREAPRALAIGIAYLALFGAIALVVAWVTPYVSDAVKQTPQHMPAASGETWTVAYRWLQRVGVSPAVIDRAVSMTSSAIEAGAQRLATAFVHLAAYLPWLVLIPILSFFLLKDARALTEGAIGLVPARWRSHAPVLLERMDDALSAYIRAQLLACLIVGAAVGIGFGLLRVPFAVILAVGAGLAEFVPLVGPLVVAAVSAAVAATRAPADALWVLLFLGVLRLLEDYVIYPRLVGSSVHLHPLAVILAVLAGGELGGIVGVLLSVPVLAIASTVYRYTRESSGRRTVA
jgi:predicted PurR-regulated permease PerM